MEKIQEKRRLKRAISKVTAFALIVSSLFIPQGAVAVYAENGSNGDLSAVSGSTIGDASGSAVIGASGSAVEDTSGSDIASSGSGITVEVDNQSTYKPTQIRNGNFEVQSETQDEDSEPPLWESFVCNGITYTEKEGTTPHKVDISYAIPNGVDKGWNTTETQAYEGGLFEVWDVQHLPAEKNRVFPETNGRYFIEMNANNSAAVYQDLSTQSGDVIKWTLQHSDRTDYGFNEQRMYVIIGAPERENGEIVAATGVNDNINTKIQDYGKAEYRYNGVASGSGIQTAFAKDSELAGLSVTKGKAKWCDVAGIYIVPEGQDVTRFAFCADSSSKLTTEDSKYISGGNFLDNITFSTLIGNLKATKQADGSVKITGYWGDKDATKKLVVDLGNGSDPESINMSSVCGKNFVITIPESLIGTAVSVHIYHQDYTVAQKEIPIMHEHEWNYRAGGEANKLYAYCSSTTGAACSYNSESDNKVWLALTAADAIYSGKVYDGARVSNWSVADNALAAKPAIKYYLSDGVTETNEASSGAVSAGAAPKNAGDYTARITIEDITASKNFTIKKVQIDTVAFTEPATTSGSVPASQLGTAANAFYTGVISWASIGASIDSFECGKHYTATVTIRLKDSINCEFTDGVNIPEGWEKQSCTNTSLVLTKTFYIKPKILTVTSPGVSMQLTEFTTKDDQIVALPTSVAVAVEDSSKTSMGVTWELKKDTAYSGDSDAENVFVWKINSSEYANYDTNNQKLSGEVTIKNPHRHNWNYEAQDNRLTAYCTKRGTQDCSYASDQVLTLTLTADSVTYSGNAYNGASLSEVEKTAWTAAGLVVPTIQYEGNTGTSYTRSVIAPIDAGSYKALITAGEKTAEAAFQITSSGSGSGGSGSGSGSGGSGGSVIPSVPGEAANPAETFTVPVKNENTVKVEAEIKNGTANVSEITADTIEKVVNNPDKESKVDTITIDLSGAKQEVTGVTLSKESVETLAKATTEKDNGIETATIELSKATVALDNLALKALAEQAEGTQIELVVADKEREALNSAQQATLNQCQVATTFEAYFTSDGIRIHDFKGGKAVVSIDFTPEAGKDTSYYHLVYVADNGSLTRYKTKYEDGKLMFTTTHFSDYAVIYDVNEKNETGEQPETADEKDSGTDTEGKITLDTSYSRLRLRVPTSTKTTNVLKWTRESDADGYVIYGCKCNTQKQTYKMVKLVTIRNGATTTWTDTNLDSATYYKYYIKAYKLVNGKKVWLARSKVVHSTTTGGKYGNAKSVAVNQESVSMAVGKKFTIIAEQIPKNLPINIHTSIKYESSNSEVASVSSAGMIKAKSKGTCYIYVYAQNGIYQRIKVTVK